MGCCVVWEGGVPHAVVRWSAGRVVRWGAVWYGLAGVRCRAGWWVGVVWWAAALRGVVLWGGVLACCVRWCGHCVGWRRGVGAAWGGAMEYVGWYSVVLCGVVGRCVRAAAW